MWIQPHKCMLQGLLKVPLPLSIMSSSNDNSSPISIPKSPAYDIPNFLKILGKLLNIFLISGQKLVTEIIVHFEENPA